jgi:hypothetical protein
VAAGPACTHADFYAEYCDLEVPWPDDPGTTGQTFIQILSALTPRDQAKVLREIIQSSGPTSAVDRVYWVLHGYLQAVCDGAYAASRRREVQAEHPKLSDLGPRSQDIGKVLYASASILDALLPVRNHASVAHPNQELLGEAESMLVINVGRSLLHYLDAKLCRRTSFRMGSEKSHGSLMNARQTGVVMSARPVDLRRTSGRPVAPLLRERLDSREDIDIIWRAPARIVRGAGGGVLKAPPA